MNTTTETRTTKRHTTRLARCTACVGSGQKICVHNLTPRELENGFAYLTADEEKVARVEYALYHKHENDPTPTLEEWIETAALQLKLQALRG